MAINTAQRAQTRAGDIPKTKRQNVPVTRRDAWWIEPVLTVVAFIAFSLYALWRALEARYINTYALGSHYLSPFYSPPIQEWVHITLPISPALFVLLFPLSFRASCYFCRRSYYRAFFWDPPPCAVPESVRRPHYTGERTFPFVLQNLHRYVLYAIFIWVVFHWIHLYQACVFTGAAGTHFGIGLGTLVLLFDTLMLTAYVVSCHSFRHLAGGVVNRFSRSGASQARFRLWKGVSALNARHGLFFWLSLLSVGLADFYVRMVASGVLHDLRLL